jgi:hypothetical protein
MIAGKAATAFRRKISGQIPAMQLSLVSIFPSQQES